MNKSLHLSLLCAAILTNAHVANASWKNDYDLGQFTGKSGKKAIAYANSGNCEKKQRSGKHSDKENKAIRDEQMAAAGVTPKVKPGKKEVQKQQTKVLSSAQKIKNNE